MQSGYNSKIMELQKILMDIKSGREELMQIELIQKDDLVFFNKLEKKKKSIEKKTQELIAKKNKLNEELIENDEIFETTRMKYAIMLLLNFGSSEPKYCL